MGADLGVPLSDLRPLCVSVAGGESHKTFTQFSKRENVKTCSCGFWRLVFPSNRRTLPTASDPSNRMSLPTASGEGALFSRRKFSIDHLANITHAVLALAQDHVAVEAVSAQCAGFE